MSIADQRLHFIILLLIYDLQSEDWINTYYMVMAF